MSTRIIAIVAVSLSACTPSVVPSSSAPQTSPSQSPQLPAQQPPSKPEMELTAAGLWSEYGGNVLVADGKLKGKWLKVTGDVTGIRPEGTGHVLGFETVLVAPLPPAEVAALPERERRWFLEGYPPGVRCHIDPTFDVEFAAAKPRKKFAVLGRCEGRKEDPEVYRGYVVRLLDCRPAELKR